MAKVVSAANAGKGQYGELVRKIAKLGKCPFCPGEFEKYNPEPVYRHGGWFASVSIRPYKYTKHHFLIISEEHKERLEDLTQEDALALLHIRNWLVHTYNLVGYTYFMRIGDLRHTNASVCHLHEHVIMPDVDRAWTLWERFLLRYFPKRLSVWAQLSNPAAPK